MARLSLFLVAAALLFSVLCVATASGQGLRTGFGGQVRGPLLLAHKTLLNAEAVVHQPLTCVVTIYNVGDAPAFEVRLHDKQWLAVNAESLTPLYGTQNPSWPVLLPGANISHSYAIEPVVGGALTIEQSVGMVSYTASPSPNADTSLTRTTDIGTYLAVGYSQEAERRVKPHVFEWGIFTAAALASLSIPYFIWTSARSSFNSLLK